MKLWSVDCPVASEFPYPVIDGPWKRPTSEENIRSQEGPYRIEWPSSRVKLADFIWPESFATWIARKNIAEELVDTFRGARLHPVEMRSKRPPRPPDHWLKNPYAVIWIDHFVTADEDRSTFHRYIDQIGRPAIELLGTDGYYNKAFDDPAKFNNTEFVSKSIFRVRRTPSKGVFVDQKQLEGCDFFRIRQIPMVTLCTDRVADFIREKGYNNIELLEYGDVI